MDTVAFRWVSRYVPVIGAAELTHEQPWAHVWRVPVRGGHVWFKWCAEVQAFEPSLTAALGERSPELLPDVIATDVDRRWLLLSDAGQPARELGNPPELWSQVLPLYAELQQREMASADAHLAAGVPDLRVERLPERLDELLSDELPISDQQRDLIRRIEPEFREWCAELAQRGIGATVQHEDLHHNNLFVRDGRPRIIDWGDSVISHPFASLVVTFEFLETVNRLPPDDAWFGRLRDAYLEPWGTGLVDTFNLAMRVGTVAHAIAWLRQRAALPALARAEFDIAYGPVLSRVSQLALG